MRTGPERLEQSTQRPRNSPDCWHTPAPDEARGVSLQPLQSVALPTLGFRPLASQTLSQRTSTV